MYMYTTILRPLIQFLFAAALPGAGTATLLTLSRSGLSEFDSNYEPVWQCYGCNHRVAHLAPSAECRALRVRQFRCHVSFV